MPPSRWAITTALVDAVVPLTDLAGRDAPPGAARDLVSDLDLATVTVEQDGVQHPPSPQAMAMLDQLIPHPHPASSQRDGNLLEAVAGLLHATRPGRSTLTVNDVRAATLAAQIVSTTMHPAAGQAGTRNAARAWAAARHTLRPFHDGTMPRGVSDQITEAAAQVRHACATALQPNGAAADTLSTAAQHLPALADHLKHVLRRWARTGAVLAYACDLPIPDDRPERITPALAGHKPTGLIQTDGRDLAPADRALTHARTLTTAAAVHTATLAYPIRAARLHAAHSSWLAAPTTPARIATAHAVTRRTLAAAPVQRRPHR